MLGTKVRSSTHTNEKVENCLFPSGVQRIKKPQKLALRLNLLFIVPTPYYYQLPLTRTTGTEMASFNAWKTYLEGYSPCNFPDLVAAETSKPGLASVSTSLKESYDRLQSFANKHCNNDVAAIFCTAWSLVLRAYTGQDTVCFGRATSNVNACRIDFTSDKSILRILETLETTCVENRQAPDVLVSQLSQGTGDFITSFFDTCVLSPNQQRAGQEIDSAGLDMVRRPPSNTQDNNILNLREIL